MPLVTMTVNGTVVSAEVEARTLLAEFLRNHLEMTGTHVGCDTTQCGCCTVHLDGVGVKSCTVLAVACQSAQVLTIEGLATGDALHPMQAAFREHHGLQCGFCTPGMIMATAGLLSHTPQPTEAQIFEGLAGNLCRCTGYIHIVESVKLAAKTLQEKTA